MNDVENGRRARNRRALAVTALLVALVIGLWLLTVLVGERTYTLADLVGVIAGQNVPGASFAIGEIRLPKALLGLAVGAAFGLAGTTSQTLLRNQLASPDIVGITSGASASAVFAILVLGWSGFVVNIVAIVCGIATALLVYALAGSGSAMGGRLILIGIGVSAMFTSAISYMQLKASIYDVSDALRWVSGSLSSASWNQVPLMFAALAMLGGTILWLGRDLRVFTLGDDAATGLGVNVACTRMVLIVAMVALASFATAATGPIAFVSFLAGPIVKRLVGRSDRLLLVPAALMGAALVLGADFVGQNLLPNRFPVGVITGLVGSPYLLFQLVRINRQGASA